MLKPIDGATLTKNFEVRYTISGERPLKYVRIYLDDVVVAEESTAKKNVTQIEKIA
jgi:translation initiation factor IF-1